MARDLVPVIDDPAHERGVPFRDPPQHEHRGPRPDVGEDIEERVRVRLQTWLHRRRVEGGQADTDVLGVEPVLDVERCEESRRRVGGSVFVDRLVAFPGEMLCGTGDHRGQRPPI